MGEKYKYRLLRAYTILTPFMLEQSILTHYITLIDGRLTIRHSYSWDGPSGITKTLAAGMPESFRVRFLRSFMRGSLVHDALYQLCRERWLDYTIHRWIADKMLQHICIEDGMSSIRAGWVFQGVHLFGERHARPPS